VIGLDAVEGRPVRKLLFHSYHFPPIGGSGAQRPLKMARHLSELGYEPVVVTRGLAEREDRWAPVDRTLAAEIPAGLDIRRVPAAEPEPTARWRPLAERWLGVRDRWTAWWIDASYRAGLDCGADADLIYVWMQPYASAEAGARLSRSLGKPWVADLGDPWALDEMIVHPSRLHRRAELRRMGRVLSTAAAVVMSTPEAADRLVRTFPDLAGRPVVAIPNGFDRDDFTGSPPARKDGAFRIVHTGYLHTELGEQHRRRRLLRRALGGSAPGLDIISRSHFFLIEAIDRLLDREPRLGESIELHLAGVLNETDRRVAMRCPVVTMHGYVSHAESIELMRAADLLFLPMHTLPAGERATIVPGKTYEYLASGTPILAAVPDGDARDILADAGNAILVRPDDVMGMAHGILREFERRRTGAAPMGPDPHVVSRFEYATLARELAGVFDSVLATGRGAAMAGATGGPVSV
jgi:glycosyltransferase involved in cell wall biosynthesis